MSTSAPSSSTNANPPPAAEVYQPTVRVMRLYKPGFHLVSTLPFVPCSDQLNASKTSVADFALSPFLLLPDSFGDIYSGEKFSAYIAVVNGYQNIPFYQVSLAIRLQTTSTVIDLTDTRSHPGISTAKTLGFNETSDMIVQHSLTELGIHTLRVSVQYLISPTSEVKTLRKFYRFNVLQPLNVTSYFVEVDNKPLIQCQVTNATKTPIYIEELNFIPLNQYSTIVDLNKPKQPLTISDDNDEFKDYFSDSIRLLQPDESYAFSFLFSRYQNSGVVTKSVGHPEIKWCTTMGEFSIFRANDTLQKGIISGVTPVNSNFSANNIRIQCLSCPNQVNVGETFDITLRISNVSPRPIPARLQCLNTTTSSDGYYSTPASPTATGSGNNTPKGSNPSLAAAGATVNTCLGLCVTGLTYVSIGKIESGEFVDTTINVFAVCAGLHDLVGVYVVDAITKQRYSNDNLCKVFVVDNDDEQLSEEESKEEILLQQQREAQLLKEKIEREKTENETRERLQSEEKRFREDEKRRELAKLEQIKKEEELLRLQQEMEQEAQQKILEEARIQRQFSMEERGDIEGGNVDEVVSDDLLQEVIGLKEVPSSQDIVLDSLHEESLLEELTNVLESLEDAELASVKESVTLEPHSIDPSPVPEESTSVLASRDISPYPPDENV